MSTTAFSLLFFNTVKTRSFFSKNSKTSYCVHVNKNLWKNICLLRNLKLKTKQKLLFNIHIHYSPIL